jgi:hypothetical protein
MPMTADAGAVVRVGAIPDKEFAWMCRVLLFRDDPGSLNQPGRNVPASRRRRQRPADDSMERTQ